MNLQLVNWEVESDTPRHIVTVLEITCTGEYCKYCALYSVIFTKEPHRNVETGDEDHGRVQNAIPTCKWVK